MIPKWFCIRIIKRAQTNTYGEFLIHSKLKVKKISVDRNSLVQPIFKF